MMRREIESKVVVDGGVVGGVDGGAALLTQFGRHFTATLSTQRRAATFPPTGDVARRELGF
jgi:hypothetical protein